MAHTTRLILALWISACGSSAPERATSPSTPQNSAAPPASSNTEASASGTLCPSNGEYTFSFEASGIEVLEGKTIWAFITGDRGGSQPSIVRLAGTVSGGRIALSCPRSLVEDNAYPSAAVVADVDGVPGCSDNDKVLTRTQMYAVGSDVGLTLVDDQLRPIQATQSWLDSRPTVAERNKAAANATGGGDALAPRDICMLLKP